MKFYLSIFLFLAAPAFVFATTFNANLEISTILTIDGVNFTVAANTANLDSITVNASNFTVDLDKRGSITVTSAGKKSFTVSPAGYIQDFTCGASESSLTVAGHDDTATTITITPSSAACVSGGGGSSSGGGGGGGGGGSTYVPPAVSTPAPMASSVPAATVATPSQTAVSVSPVFTKGLQLGSNNGDVKRLQQLLNSDPATAIATFGVGSPGNETNYFGGLTKKALQKFQLKHGIVKNASDPGYGYLGPKTRAKMLELFENKLENKEQVQAKVEARTPTQAQAASQLQAQIQVLLEKVKALQAQIQATQ